MGDSLRQRLMGISTDFGPSETTKPEDENK
jgi:hypothetical protein